MTEMTRIGVVGCGFFAQNHLNAWATLKSEGVKIAAVCDLSEENARKAAEAFGADAWYTDVSAMIAAANLDMIDIVTQVASHQALVGLALDAGIPTIVQKPFGQNLAECEAMLSQASQKNISLGVHENFRFQHPNRTIQDTVSTGKIGTPTWGRISFRTGYDIYAGQPYLRDEERFIVTDVGVHVLDLARFFFGEVAHVSAELQKRDPDLKGEDTATITLRHTSGAVCLVDCTYASHQLPDPFPATLVEIEGTEGALRLDGALTLFVSSGTTLTRMETDPPVLPWAERPWHVVQDSVQATCQHFLQCLRSGQAPETSAADNIKTYALAEAAYQAHDQGKAVRPAY